MEAALLQALSMTADLGSERFTEPTLLFGVRTVVGGGGMITRTS